MILLLLYVLVIVVLLVVGYRQLASAAGSDQKTAKGMLLLTLALLVTVWVA